MTPPLSLIDKQEVANSFSKAAQNYDAFAFIQREIGERLLERLDLMNIQPRTIVDLGCGTGHFTRALKKKYGKAKVTGVDIAPGMIEVARSKNSWFKSCEYHCADMDSLPFDDNSVDLLFSNLALQWVPNEAKTFAEFSRVLKPEGLIIFATLGPDTLTELRRAWRQVDEQVHVNEFIDMHDLGDAMLKAGIADPVVDMEHIRLTYKTLNGLFKDLKGIGAHNMNQGRPNALMSKSKWFAMTKAYQTFCDGDGLYPVTYEAVYGHGWGRRTSSDVYEVSL